MIKELIKLAGELDRKGYLREADALDKIIRMAASKLERRPQKPQDSGHTHDIESLVTRETTPDGENLSIESANKSTGFRKTIKESTIDVEGVKYEISYEKVQTTPDGKAYAEWEVMIGTGPVPFGAWKSGFSKVKTTDQGLKYYNLTKYPPEELPSSQKFDAYVSALTQRASDKDKAQIKTLTSFS
jgi:hypothetical protein